ncbi:MAG: hypothetical protein K6T57_03900 [Thermaceae bacterium]|nr:hypothetical protein [Thermaceae bacterium]
MVRGAAKMSPDQGVEAAKARLREAFQRAEQEFRDTADELQNRVLQTAREMQEDLVSSADRLAGRLEVTADHLQGQFQEGLEHLAQPWREAVRTGEEAIRHRPLEALATAILAGWVVGSLSKSSPAPPAAPQPPSLLKGLLADLALGGVGKMVWDVVQKEYLTPDTIKQWIETLLNPKKT